MGKLQVLDFSGHTTLEFDQETKAGVAEAMAKFEELVKGKKFTAAEKVGDGKFVLARNFNPLAEEIILQPPLQGG